MNITKSVLHLIGVLVLSVCINGCVKTEAETQIASQTNAKPNIIFILLDDLGYGDVGYLGSEIKTPNIDALANQGVVISHSYAYPICSPTRAALMTGKNPLGFGIDGPMENDAMLPESLTTMPEMFRDAGYQTWMVGKWHLGMAKKSAMPHNRGFDDFYGFLGGFVDFYTHVYFGGLDWQHNDTSLREEGHATDLLAHKAIEKIQNYNNDAPFFMYLSLNAPHTPLQYVPEPIYDYSAIPSADRRVFADMTSHVDQRIGEVLQALEDKGIADNTLVVFMSDNGGNLEAGANNGQLLKGKASAYEGGVRVPTIVRWPAGLSKKNIAESPLFTQDWLPTLLDAADIQYDPANFDGQSMFTLLKTGTTDNTQRTVLLGTAKSKAVYQWPFKLIKEGTDTLLFNLLEDEFEQHNLAAMHPDLVAALSKQLTSRTALPSKAAKGPPPESLFYGPDGNFIYDIRKPETRAPWVETAE
ncbi:MULTISPECIES: arylsulfatase B [Aliiglaciecola]|uniref:arylsulfatase B n=1 Tax=Aliiglaciecola TaxID=1406885 RepID=UPI001C08C5BE|nr:MULTISPECIES: arylsulfatase [Aliiglaciecola]MBU2876847.1 arylsulfatase [Aliiglaciecola lipolytica]MDO6711950.1 arylsulfatase [Aliiglaciecola sp. 2_MG-2023]MDO6753076.1 arylsulfatase [Aliiglaciecola sp. 1_MG-2023]